ncbi:MAG TPA: hypothetical protein VGZ22_15735 [Isosphaeraceae bacterium]|jgi:hypothetical protein|nr:hypothetical protein [Isosphaeraceae bacterium]
MRRKLCALARALIWIAVCAGPLPGAEPELAPALTVRLVHPDLQGERLLKLFERARAPHPAAALAAWRQATRDRNPRGLGKGPEALIALFNPEMIAELRLLHGAELVLGFDPPDGRARWFATVPQDDGTFAALATALALTDGTSEAALGDALVDRLGRPGSALMARRGTSVVAAGSRDDLVLGLARLRIPPTSTWPPLDCGALFRLDPAALGASGPLPRKRLAEALRALGCQRVDGRATLKDETLSVALNGRFGSPPPGTGTIDPAWLEWVPARRSLAAFAMAIDPRPEAWDAAFAAADRVERMDPAKANVAPLRTRINLVALAAKVQPEVELWPRLLGVSACVTADPAGSIDGALIALHATDAAAAERISTRVVPALARPFLSQRPADPPAPDGAALVVLGQLSGRALAVSRQGTTVLIGWNGILSDCLDAQSHPQHSAGPALSANWGGNRPHRFGALWPGRVPVLTAASAPAAFALAEAPAIVWTGRIEGTSTRDEVFIIGLRAVVRRFLERLPMKVGDGG